RDRRLARGQGLVRAVVPRDDRLSESAGDDGADAVAERRPLDQRLRAEDAMRRRIVHRLAVAAALLCAIPTAAFFLLHSQTDHIAPNLLRGTASAQQIARLEHELGLDLPAWMQFGSWTSHAVRGDLG